MATRVWNAGTAGNWYTVTDWTTLPPAAADFPQPGDIVLVNSGTAIVDASHGVIDQEQVTLGAATSVTPAAIFLQSATFGSGMVITSGVGAGFGTLQASGSSVFAGTLTADAAGGLLVISVPNAGAAQGLNVTGTIDVSGGDTVQVQTTASAEVIATGAVNVSGGTFQVGADATFVNSGMVTVDNAGIFELQPGATLLGTGTIALAGSSTASLGEAAFPFAQTISFLDNTGTLALSDPTGFAGGIVNFQIGDVIDLIGMPNNWVEYVNGKVSLGAAGSDGKTASIRLSAPTGSVLGAKSDGNGGTLIQIAADRSWTGATSSDWYDAGNWSTAAPFTNAAPGPGDMARLMNGSATITAADVAQYGALNDVQVIIGGTATPSLQMTGETVGAGTSIGLENSGTTTSTSAQLTLLGNTTLDGAITARGVNGLMTVTIGSDGTAANLTISPTVIGGSSGVIDSSSEAGLLLNGTGTISNNGLIQVGGGLTIASGLTLAGSGTLQIVASGTAIIDAAVGAGQVIQFNEAGEKLVLGDVANFHGTIEGILASDTIEIDGITNGSVSYDSSSHTLSVLQNSTVAAQVTLSGSYDPVLFSIGNDSDGIGSDIIYQQPADQIVTHVSLPVAAMGAPGAVVSLEQLLTNAFGGVPANMLQHGVTLSYTNAEELAQNNSSYWDPTDPSVSTWLVNGNDIGTGTTHITADQFSNVALQLGNNISMNAYLEVPVSFNSGGSATAFVSYQIATVDSAVMRTDYATVPPTAADIVTTASLFASTYTDVPNNNDCPNISADVGAAAGAVHPAEDTSTDPTQNLPGGFWDIVYQGTTSNPVTDWYTKLQSGDFIRMGWNNGGQHTTTVVDATVTSSGSIYVYDNDAPLSPGISGIGLHYDEYWLQTDPSTITIYRLNATQQYLISGTTNNGEVIQGSIYNDLIEPLMGADTITGGPGNDEVRGTGAALDRDSVTDWHAGDTLDFIDFAPGNVSTEYDPTSGVLLVHAGSLSAAVTLVAHLVGPFGVTPDGTGGALISEAPCYVAGTRIATPDGETAIDALREGDLVLTADGTALPVVWMGHRQVDCTRHPQPERVWPIRISAAAFAPQTPARELFLSPDHAVFVDDVLVPVKYLVNGRTIVQVPVAEVTYFHLELPRHAVVRAEGLTAESYLDTGDRAKFANAGRVVSLYPDFASHSWEARGCAPLVIAGPKLAAIRERLARQRRSRRRAA